jgi:hypothetical protein
MCILIFPLYSTRGSLIKGGFNADSVRSGSFSCIPYCSRRSGRGRGGREVRSDSWSIRSVKQSMDIH